MQEGNLGKNGLELNYKTSCVFCTFLAIIIGDYRFEVGSMIASCFLVLVKAKPLGGPVRESAVAAIVERM